MRASTALAIRSGIVAFALGLLAVLAAGRARAESPTAFNVAQSEAAAPSQGPPASKPTLWRGSRARPAPLWRGARTTSAPFYRAPSPVSIFASDVVAELRRHLGQGNFTGMPGAWCAYAISSALVASGHRPLASGMAYSALYYGPHLASPRPGALIVLRGHVGLIEAVHGASLTMISGNYGHRVREAEIPTRRAIAFVAIP